MNKEQVSSALKLAHSIGFLNDGDEKKYSVTVTNDNPNGIWCYSDNCFDEECAYWSAVTTSVIRKVSKTCFIPERCMNCWKVNVTPQTIGDLIYLYEIQADYDGRAKCGIDPRPMTENLYSGFYYFRSLKEAQEFAGGLNLDMPVTIKRGCTPIEMEYGENWVQGDSDIENYVKRKVELVCLSKRQSLDTKEKIIMRWKGFPGKKVSNPVSFKDYSEN